VTARRCRFPVLLAVLALAACAAPQPVRTPPPFPQPPSVPAPDRLGLIPSTFTALPGWREDAAAQVLPALNRTCDRLMRLPPDKSVGNDGMGGTAADWQGPCAAARRLPADDHETVRQFFEGWFSPFMVTNNGNADGLFTGYFEPELAGSRSRSRRFSVPILGKPKDLVVRGDQTGRLAGGALVPYPTRAEIEAGALGSLAPVIAWVEDPVDAHILHIQGSGRLTLEDGSILRLGVAATNGHKFVGVGRLLRERGLLDDISMPSIRAWLKGNPAQAKALMAENPRYVFYRIQDGDGPVGSEGVTLTPERSLAVDPRFIPLGLPLFLDTVDPAGNSLRRLVMAQDTGGAIKGPIRGDFFWGRGEAAFEKAGRMKSQGRYWVMLPRVRSPRIALADPSP
jgi:membrane-bound lytic murein transglycosylase A